MNVTSVPLMLSAALTWSFGVSSSTFGEAFRNACRAELTVELGSGPHIAGVLHGWMNQKYGVCAWLSCRATCG